MILIISVFVGMTLNCAEGRPADPSIKYYASKYDHIDVETILNNRRMVNYYAACLLGGGPCPPEGVEFKRILPEALHTNCGRCTDKQATVTFRAIKRLKKEYPKIWNQLSEKWDPDDIYVKKFESTFWLRNDATKNTIAQPVLLDRFGGQPNSETTDNTIGSFSLASTTSHEDSTTRRVLTSTNSIPSSFTTSTNTKTTDYPYSPYELTSLVSKTKTTTKPSSTSTFNALPSIRTTANFKPSSSTTFRSTSVTNSRPTLTYRLGTTTNSPRTTESTIKTSTSPQFVPNLIPINTFFTNPSRPFINLNIGANIGATVSGLVRGIGALGTRFMETGADIAEVVIKNFARPLQVGRN